MSKPRIGFIGLGIMGKPMSSHLLQAGYVVMVHNRSREPVAELVEAGAGEAHSPGEVAENSDVIITMLPDSPDVEEVALGPGGIIEGVSPGDVYIDMSTIAPSVALEVGGAMAEKGVRCLDAPVSGGDVGARNATLSIMVGGEEEVFDSVRPIFATMGQNIVLCGPSGRGADREGLQPGSGCRHHRRRVGSVDTRRQGGRGPSKHRTGSERGSRPLRRTGKPGRAHGQRRLRPRLPHPASLQGPQHHHENRQRLQRAAAGNEHRSRTVQSGDGQRPGRTGSLRPADRGRRPGRCKGPHARGALTRPHAVQRMTSSSGFRRGDGISLGYPV